MNETASHKSKRIVPQTHNYSRPEFNILCTWGNQISISDFPGFLTKWNKKMHWGFSPHQIENYSRTLQDGVLKKYRTNPYYLSLEIPDVKPFCLEVGDAIGLSKNQSEAFAIAADNDLRRAKITSNRPLTIPFSPS
jgi:hypothetical protein